MKEAKGQRLLLFSTCVVMGATAAWLTTELAGKPQPRQIAIGPKYDLYPRSPEMFAGDAFFLYNFADVAVTWRNKVRDKLKIKSVRELVEHSNLPESATVPFLQGDALILLGVDVDGFGKAGDWIWVVVGGGRKHLVILDGSGKLNRNLHNFCYLPVDYRWCNAVNGKFLDLISE